MASLPPTDFDFANMPSGADPEERWAYISRAVEHIMTDPELRVSSKGYSGLYTAVYDYCRPGTKGQGCTCFLCGVLESAAGTYCATLVLNANLAASDLYNKLSLYFISHLKGITGVLFPPGGSSICSLTHLFFRKRTLWKTLTCCSITPMNGLDIHNALSVSIACSLILIGFG